MPIKFISTLLGTQQGITKGWSVTSCQLSYSQENNAKDLMKMHIEVFY